MSGDPSEPGHPDNPRSDYDATLAREAGTGWPGPAVVRVMPPTPVYDHRSMRESGRPRPHILNPDTLTRTYCGKDPSFWKLHATPVGDFDFQGFVAIGCAVCAKKALKVSGGE